MSEMQQQMQQNEQPPANDPYIKTQATEAPKKPAHEDYIDYEEIK